jgi:cytochrome b involved in lipid metabolism
MSHLQVEKHSTKDDCWMSIHGKVYDVTKFLEEHPGGEEVMLEVAGESPSHQFTGSRLLTL